MNTQHKMSLALTITTKKGDSGITRDFNGKEYQKSSNTVLVLGQLDILNCHIGAVRIHAPNNKILEKMQVELFTLGSVVANFNNKYSSTEMVDCLEEEIKSLTQKLPPLRNFIMPTGTRHCIDIHLCRSICRQCEHHLCKLKKTSAIKQCIILLNRFSDYMFMLAYEINCKQGKIHKISNCKLTSKQITYDMAPLWQLLISIVAVMIWIYTLS